MELKHEKGEQDFESAPAFNRTLWNWNNILRKMAWSRRKLLIVPYGIETEDIDSKSLISGLLIVPYGIETNMKCKKCGKEVDF